VSEFPSPKRGSLPEWMRDRLDDQQRFLALCILCGLICGLVGVGFHYAIHGLFGLVWWFARSQTFWGFITVMLCAPTLGGLLVGIAVQKWAPQCAGSGIPQTKAAYFNKGGNISARTGVWRFFLGILYVGLGNSLGREGPTVHVSAAVGSKIGRWGFRDPARKQAMVPVGVAGGIAAAFNAPIAAIMFVFEELLDDFSTKALGGIAIAVVIASTVSRMILGEDPIVQTHLGLHYQTSLWMLVAIPLGLVAGLFGPIFTGSILRLRQFLKTRKHVPLWLRPATGGLVIGCLGISAWLLTGMLGTQTKDVFSVGYDSLELAFEAKLAFGVLAVLFVFKGLAVIINYATGGSGGLFSPTLFLGGMIGGMAGMGLAALQEVFPLPGYPGDQDVIGACVLLGMGALFGSVIRNPLTSLIMIFEMTGTYSLILPLMVGNLIAWAIASKLSSVSIYNALLLQDGISLRHLPSYRGSQDYAKLPVSTIMTHDVESLPLGNTVQEVRLDLKERPQRHHGYPIADDDGKLCGIVTRAEIQQATPEMTIAEIISEQNLFVVDTNCSIRDAANHLITRSYQQVPVVSPTNPGKMVGILTLNDISRQQNASDGTL
jgi:CIC family chloride channel protein